MDAGIHVLLKGGRPEPLAAHATVSELLDRMTRVGARHAPLERFNEVVAMISSAADLDIRADVGTHLVLNSCMPLSAAIEAVRGNCHAIPIVEAGRVEGFALSASLLRTVLSEGLGEAASGHPTAMQLSYDDRRSLLREHEVLRLELAAITRRTADLADDAFEPREELRTLTIKLLEDLVRHMDGEETILIPAFRQRAAVGGELRVQELMMHHRQQRRELIDILHSLSRAKPAAEVRRALTAFVDDLLLDMAYEDEELFAAPSDGG